jgi:hypothetical protein
VKQHQAYTSFNPCNRPLASPATSSEARGLCTLGGKASAVIASLTTKVSWPAPESRGPDPTAGWCDRLTPNRAAPTSSKNQDFA